MITTSAEQIKTKKKEKKKAAKEKKIPAIVKDRTRVESKMNFVPAAHSLTARMQPTATEFS